MSWTRFLAALCFYCAAIGVALYAFILILDPYQDVPFSPAFARAPVSTNQRFAYPALARNPAFDSAIIGTSTLRLFDPVRLDALFDARFVNLAMNSATAYEQSRIHEVFMRHHPAPRMLIFGIDLSWCQRQREIEKYTFRAFPEWMYDDDRWNDLAYLFNDKALENAVRMLEYLQGRREAKYRTDGFRDLDRDFGRYDLAKTRANLYRNAPGGVPAAYRVPALAPVLARPQWRFASHELLPRMLARIPDDTLKIVVFVPFHGFMLSASAALIAECKGRISAIVGERPNTIAIDYTIDSVITREDDNYWDALHVTTEIARDMERDIAAVARGSDETSGAYRLLNNPAIIRGPARR